MERTPRRNTDFILWRLPVVFAPGHEKMETLDTLKRSGIRMGCITPCETGLLPDDACYKALQIKSLEKYFEPGLCMVYPGHEHLDPSGLLIPRLHRCEDIDDLKRVLFVGLTPAEIRYAQDIGLTTALFDPHNKYLRYPLPPETARIQSVAAVEELVYDAPTTNIGAHAPTLPMLRQPFSS